MQNVIIELKDLDKVYPLGKVSVHAAKKVNLKIGEGEFCSVSGPSGSGKSTILNMIGLIDTPTGGELFLDGKSVYTEGELTKINKKKKIPSALDKRLTALRRKEVGFIFQSFNLISVLDVEENVLFPLALGGKKISAKERERAAKLIDRVGLTKWKKHKSYELSGGQRQRVAIARALATSPRVVLADEPTANLDSKTGKEILALMQEMNRELNTTFVFSTHDDKVVSLTTHRIRILDGEVVSDEYTEAS